MIVDTGLQQMNDLSAIGLNLMQGKIRQIFQTFQTGDSNRLEREDGRCVMHKFSLTISFLYVANAAKRGTKLSKWFAMLAGSDWIKSQIEFRAEGHTDSLDEFSARIKIGNN